MVILSSSPKDLIVYRDRRDPDPFTNHKLKLNFKKIIITKHLLIFKNKILVIFTSPLLMSYIKPRKYKPFFQYVVLPAT